jgi:Zinc carboxypeptidase
VTVQSLGPNSDGCDIECCSDVLVQGCRFDTEDDCMVVSRVPGGSRAHPGNVGLSGERRMIGSPSSASGSRLLGLTTAVLLAGAVYGAGKLQAHEGPGDSYRLDRIREVGSPVGSASASDSRQIQQSLAASFPGTGFEQRNGSSWTTLAEEQQFLSELDTASDRVRVSVLGRTLQERPIRLVVAGPPLTNSRIKTRGAILFVCTQHGLEPAGREACLQLARNHAASASTTTLLIIPTANPDGVAASTRENPTGADINRDHVRLDTREARLLAGSRRLPPSAGLGHARVQNCGCQGSFAQEQVILSRH